MGALQIDAYLAFGGNIGDVSHRIFAAWEELERLPIIISAAHSPLYRTAPVGGPPEQSDYVNAASRVRTTASARELLDICLDIERRHGRERLKRWGPRTLDIDLLLYGQDVIDEPGLCVPHPHLRERLFVLGPLSDVAPEHLTLPPDGALLRDVRDQQVAQSGETLKEWRARVLEPSAIQYPSD